MARRRNGLLDDLVEIAAKLPWGAGVGLALVAYLGFHYLANQPMTPAKPVGMNTLGQDIGGMMVRTYLTVFSSFLQYIVPIALLIGAFASFIRRRRQSALHYQVAKSPTRDALEQMSWREFEGLTAEVFRRKGFQVIERGGNGPDGGVDLELRAGRDKYLVQCKQWKAFKVGVATVRELYGVMAAEGAVGGFVVTSGEFTADAKRFAEGQSIELVSTDVLLRLIKETGCVTTPAKAPEKNPACPKCGETMVRRRAKRGEAAGSEFWGCARYPQCRGIRAIEP